MVRDSVRGNLYLTVPFADRFVYNPSGTIISEWGIVRETGQLIKNHLDPQRVLLVTDGGMKDSQVYDDLCTSLRQEEVDFVEFSEVSPDPTTEMIDQGAELAKAERCTAVLGLGGGSSIDSAKGIALLLRNPGSLKEYRGRNKIQSMPAPIIAIPTTAGTGSEVTPWIVAKDTQNLRKYAVSDSLVIPQLAILDPLATVSLPPHLTAGTGMDALTHAIESYTNTCNNPISETLAVEAIRLIGANIRRAFANGQNRSARSSMLHASLLAGMAFANAKTGIIHDLSMLCGAHFHSPHGVTNAAILPHAMEFSYMANPEKYRVIAKSLGENIEGLDLLEAAYRAIVAVKNITKDLNLGGLRSLGIKEEAIPEIARMAEIPTTRDISPRLTTTEEKISILQAAMDDL